MEKQEFVDFWVDLMRRARRAADPGLTAAEQTGAADGDAEFAADTWQQCEKGLRSMTVEAFSEALREAARGRK